MPGAFPTANKVVSIRSPAPGEIHDRDTGRLQHVDATVSIRSPAPGEIHRVARRALRNGRRRFNPLPSARGDPHHPGDRCRRHQPLVSIRSPAPGEIHALHRPMTATTERCFNPLPSARGDPRLHGCLGLDRATFVFQSAPQRPGRSTAVFVLPRDDAGTFQSAPQRPGRSTPPSPRTVQRPAGFNPLPSARGDPRPKRRPTTPRRHPFQSAPQRPGRSTTISIRSPSLSCTSFNPLPSARGDPRTLRNVLLRKVWLA